MFFCFWAHSGAPPPPAHLFVAVTGTGERPGYQEGKEQGPISVAGCDTILSLSVTLNYYIYFSTILQKLEYRPKAVSHGRRN